MMDAKARQDCIKEIDLLKVRINRHRQKGKNKYGVIVTLHNKCDAIKIKILIIFKVINLTSREKCCNHLAFCVNSVYIINVTTC